MKSKENPPRRVRCPHCGILRAPFAERWCDDCERQGELALGGAFTPRHEHFAEKTSSGGLLVPEVFTRPAGSWNGLEKATGEHVVGNGRGLGALLRLAAEVVWRCQHLHGTLEGVMACASRERALRERSQTPDVEGDPQGPGLGPRRGGAEEDD